jgi:hypothetical protein
MNEVQNEAQSRWLNQLFLKIFALGSPLGLPNDGPQGIPWYDNPRLLQAHRAKRKVRSRMARMSRRANRS